jgi:hypothetical protein
MSFSPFPFLGYRKLSAGAARRNRVMAYFACGFRRKLTRFRALSLGAVPQLRAGGEPGRLNQTRVSDPSVREPFTQKFRFAMKTKWTLIISLAALLATAALAQTGSAGTGSGTGAGAGTTPGNPGGTLPTQPWGTTPTAPGGSAPGGTFSGLGTNSSSVGLGIGSNSFGIGSNSMGIGSNMTTLGADRFPNRLGTNNLLLPTGRTNASDHLIQRNSPTGPDVTVPMPHP